MPGRYALYYAPEDDSPLADAGRSWLGRDASNGQACPRPAMKVLDEKLLETITRLPRRYGFHGTLKPPFALAPGRNERELRDELSAFCLERTRVSIPALELKWLGDFLALVPREPVPDLQGLADDCVRRFDSFRAPPVPEETERRLRTGLNQRQKELLARWGYPYVLDEFRFHLTLTDRVPSPEVRAEVEQEAHCQFQPIVGKPLSISSLCLFAQTGRDRPFVLISRFNLAL